MKRFGPAVNLGNIPPDEVIPLETLRRGLRADTLKEVWRPRFRRAARRSHVRGGPAPLGPRGVRRQALPHLLWQKQSSVLVHMVSELGLDVPIVELDTSSSMRYETRDRLVERYGLSLLPPPPVITVAEQHKQEGPNLWGVTRTVLLPHPPRSSRCSTR